ncbi:MAG: hypothetical protein SOR61_04785 [Evtepia sp.]|uniref:hypothetical protein n=1 Tax=Evtepia sp. TaxID=2773933 RepID=UPI002A7525DA|nr:hypothetical protein [Evtepia sp.]MDY3014498.1 hypothetical protein [Evtepia sp.]
MTIETLERRVTAFLGNSVRIPTRGEFRQLWDRADDLSRAVLTAYAECPQMATGEWEQAVVGYMQEMGLAKAYYTLEDLTQ